MTTRDDCLPFASVDHAVPERCQNDHDHRASGRTERQRGNRTSVGVFGTSFSARMRSLSAGERWQLSVSCVGVTIYYFFLSLLYLLVCLLVILSTSGRKGLMKIYFNVLPPDDNEQWVLAWSPGRWYVYGHQGLMVVAINVGFLSPINIGHKKRVTKIGVLRGEYKAAGPVWRVLREMKIND